MTSTNIKDYDPSTLRFNVVSEMYDSGRHPEDGEMMVGEMFYIQAIEPNGVKWWREVGHAGWKVTCDDGPMVVRDGKDQREVSRVAAVVANQLEMNPSPRLNHSVWLYAGATYGSVAYDRLGIEEQIAAAEREAEMWG